MTLEYTKDEIELIELLKYFRKKKLILLLCLLLSIFLSWAYMFYRGPIYEVRSIFVPPLIMDLSALNYNRSSITPLKPVIPYELYLVFKNTLLADSTKQEFNKNNKSPSHGKINISPGIGSNEVLVASYAAQPTDAINNFNQYIAFSQKKAFPIVLDSLTKELADAKTNVKKEIVLARTNLNKDKEKQLVRLNQALNIAETLAQNDVSPVPNVIEDIVNAAYLRGSTALKAEISSLKKQDSTNFPSPQLTALEQAYEKLDNITLTMPLMARTKESVVVSANLQYVNWPRDVILSSIVGLLLSCIGLTLAFLRVNRKMG